MENIRKSFPGVLALDNVSLSVRSGTVHGLMGENGAGKSTLMKCLFGIYKIEDGEIRLDGRAAHFNSAKEALLSGVAMVHQELNQAPTLSVMDNMYLGRLPRVSRYLPFISEKKLYNLTRELLSSLKIDIDPRARIDTLSVSKRQMIEIAKAISYNARVIVFDEPTSSLNEREVEKLFEIIRRLRDDGCAIIYISHKMDEIFEICDEITIMRDGKYIDTRKASDISMNELIRLMVGRVLSERYPPRISAINEEFFRVENLSSYDGKTRGISFSLRRGEILGIAGLDGAGRSELVELIFGLREKKSGEIYMNGKRIAIKSPRDAKMRGLALIGEERRVSGIFPRLSILENTVIASLEKFHTGPLLSKIRMKKATIGKIRELKIKTPSYKTNIEALSGGNQQKVIISRWLLRKPTIFLLDEPSRGIDVGAKYEIYKLIRELCDEGASIIMVSSEMGELIGLCDRICVLHEGELMGILDNKDATQEKIMTLASGECL